MTSLTLTLAKNPAVMDTLLREVDNILEEHDGVVNHETIADMPYLEACIKVSVKFIISCHFYLLMSGKPASPPPSDQK